jgi:ribose 5-phosphate isomerase A
VSQATEKALAAAAAAALVEDGQVVGLGTGSTASIFIRRLAERARAGLRVQGVPTSEASRALAASLGLPLTTLDAHPSLDLAVDGADEIDPALDLVKGAGGALLREKVVAAAARRLVVVADAGKLVPALGRGPVPVEVTAFARPVVARALAVLGAAVARRLDAAGRPFVTDEGHEVLDARFARLGDAPALAARLSAIPGVMGHGLFVGMAGLALVGRGDEVLELRRPPSAGAGPR